MITIAVTPFRLDKIVCVWYTSVVRYETTQEVHMKRYEIAYKKTVEAEPNSMQYQECGRSYDSALKKAQKIAKTNEWVSLDEYHGSEKDDCNNLMYSWMVSANGEVRKCQ